jgi:hypothetical protein
MKLDSDERAVLTFLAAADASECFNYFYGPIIEACDSDLIRADNACRKLRRRKLVDAEGRGQMASYWINAAGREVLAT